MTGKRWWQYLFEILASLRTARKLEEAATTPLLITATTTADLPTFGAAVPEPPVGIPESRDLEHCHPELRRRYLAIKSDFETETGRQLFETCTWRSAARQQELYQIGRRGVPGEKIVTKLDGVSGRSRHNVYPSQAVDVCVDVDPGPGKHPAWGPTLYEPLGRLALKHGLRWGGDWDGDGLSSDERFLDLPHLELPAGAA